MAGSGPRRRSRPSWRASSGEASPSSGAGRRSGRSSGRRSARGRGTPGWRRPRSRRRLKELAEAVAAEAEHHPGATIEVFATDEHSRRSRPIARGHHRFEWLYVTAFVSPATGESFWYIGTGVDKELFADTLALFAREAGAGRDRILLVLDGAGWHTAPGLAVPEGIRLVYLPPYTPEPQPAETLWVHVDEPLANKHFATLADLDAVVVARCVKLGNDPDLIRGQTGFHWWPKRAIPI